MKVDNLTPVVMAAPGERATCRLRIENTEDAPVLYRLRIIGFDDAHVLWPPPSPPLAAGAVEEVALELAIPDAYAAGHHSVAVEVFADRPGVPTAIAAVTVTVGTIDDVAIAVVPSTIRAHRRGSFRVDIDNRSNRPIDLDLAGEGPDLDVRLRPDRLVLRPGERVRTAGKVKGPRHLVGEPLQHSMTVTARSASAPSYAPATFQQRPLFPRGLRSMLAVLLIVAIWAGAVGAAFLWWDQRQDQAEDAPAELVDTDGDGIPDTPGDQLIDTDGDGVPDTLAAVVAEQVAAANELGPPQEGGSDRPTRTVMGGTVQSGEGGDSSGVTVTLAERDLDAGSAPAAEGAEPAALTGSAGQARALAGGAKLWPARYGRYRPVGLSAIRQTESVLSVATGEDGAWLFTDVAVGQSYELSFAQPGFDTQAFIVTPSADGKPVQVDVELEPASGQISGTIRGPGGPLGNVDLVLTDGTLTFNTASTSDAGTFLITGISTPGTYTLTADLRGFGTEVLQVTLEPGEQRGGVDITMRAGVGSISGRVTESGAPLGGVTLTASSGDLTRTTTSLTEGDRGLFNFPRLPIPGRYTITATLDGYMTQTRLVNLTGNVTGVDFDFVKTTGGIIGVVESSNGGPLTGANIRVSRDERFFETNSAVAPDPGSFTITDLPPGTYLVEFSRFDHAPFSQTVTVAAGQVVDLGRIVLTARDRPDIPQNGSLEVRVVNSQTEPLTGATVRVFRVSDGELVAEQADPAGVTSTFVFEPIDIGTYRIEVTKDVTYRTSTRRISIGLGPRVEVIPLFRLGQVSGRVVDSFQPPGEPLRQLVDYDIQILRINPDGSETIVQNIPVPVDREPDPVTGEIRWESAAASLTSGLYRVHVVNPPPGYRVVPDQVLVDGMPPMQFEVVPTDDTPIRLRDILADRFPELSGTVLAPQLSPGGAVTFQPIDSNDLEVTLTCPGTDGVDNSVLLDFPRPPPTPGADLPNSGLEDTGGGPEFDSYFFNAVTLESNDLSGECTVTVEVPAFEPAEVPVTISAARGGPHPVVFRNIAMIRPENVGGTTYWTDRGAPAPGRVDAPGVGVRTQDAPIIRFDAGVTERTEPGSEPRPVRAESFLAQTSGAGGAWAFVDPRQVFGSTDYVFGTPGLFSNRIVTIQLDQNGRAVTPRDGSSLGLDSSTPVIDVEVDAVGGTITANVNIATIKGSPAYTGVFADVSGFNVALTGANTATPTLARVGGNPGVVQAAAATFTTPDPGTHTVTVTSTATHDGTPGGRPRFVLVGPQQPPFFQPPATAVSRPPVTFIEQGAVDVRVVDVNGATIEGARVNVNGPSVSVPVTTAATPANVVAGLPVSSAIGAPTPYSVALDPAANPELDLTTATLRVFNENNVQLCGPPFFTCGPTFNVAQGGQPRAVIQVSRLGSITGRVLGIDGLGGQVPLVPPPTGELTVIARRVAVVGPNFPAIPFDCSLISPEPARPVTAVGDDPATPDVDESDAFRFSGPAGLYRIEFQHPDYQSGPEEGPPQRSDDICRDIFGSPLPGMVGSVFRVQNDVQRVLDEPFFTLPILPSVLTVSVLNDSLTPGTGGVGAPVEGATVTVTRQGTAPPPPVVLETDDGGQVTASLVPGAYSVRVTRTAPTGEPGHFPVLFDLSILPGGAPVTVRVPLPRIGGRIVGVVGAINSEGNPVTPLAGDLVPPPAAISIEQEYDAPSVQIGAGTVPNEEPQLARRTPVIDPADPADPAAPRGYVIEPVESGVHQLTLGPAPPAFRDPTPEEVTVLGLATETVDLYYVAEDREVTVTVLTDNPAVAPAGAAVQLTHPDGDARPPQVCEAVSTTSCRTTFPGVPPEMEPYGIVVNKPPLFAQATGSVQVLPGDPGVPVLAAEIRLIGTTAVIQGNVQTIDDGGGGGALATGTASVERVGAPGAPQEFPIVGGAYSFNATSRGLYRVTVSGSTFARRTIDVCVERSGTPCLPGNVAPLGDLGQTISAPTITVPELARFVLTVQNAPVASAELSVQVTGSPPHAPVVTDTPTGFSVEVDPGFGVPTPAPRPNYGFTITSPAGYVPFVIAPQPIGVGATVPLTAAMQPRTIGGTVSGAASAVTVRARRTTDGAVVGDTVSTTGTFTLPGPFPAGGYTVEAAAIGVGIGSEPAQVATNESASVTGVAVSVAARQVAITFAATPPNTNIAITGGTSGPANGGGLTQPETDATINWTATLDGWITQTGSTALVISQTDPFAAALTHTGTITVTMQRPTMSAVVNTPATPPVAVTDATVVACPGETGACTAATAGAVTLPFVAGTTQRYQAQLTGTGSGPWRIVATHASFNPSPLTVFTVAADGTISPPPPPTLTLAPP